MDEPHRERDPESYFGAGIGGGKGLFTAGGGTPDGPHSAVVPAGPAEPSVATVTEPGSTDPGQVAYWRERLSAFRETVCRSPMVDPEWLKITSHEFLVGEGVRAR